MRISELFPPELARAIEQTGDDRVLTEDEIKELNAIGQKTTGEDIGYEFGLFMDRIGIPTIVQCWAAWFRALGV